MSRSIKDSTDLLKSSLTEIGTALTNKNIEGGVENLKVSQVAGLIDQIQADSSGSGTELNLNSDEFLDTGILVMLTDELDGEITEIKIGDETIHDSDYIYSYDKIFGFTDDSSNNIGCICCFREAHLEPTKVTMRLKFDSDSWTWERENLTLELGKLYVIK